MPSNEAMRLSRKGHYSCDFCRSRKLRCDRPTPCTDCVSRGKDCVFGPALPRRTRQTGDAVIERGSAGPHLPTPAKVADSGPPATLVERLEPAVPATQPGLLEEIQALKRLAQDLETRVNANASQNPWDVRVATLTSLGAYPSPVPSWAGAGTPSSRLGQVIDVVAHLQRVSRSESSQIPAETEDILFKVDRIQSIPDRPRHTTYRGKQVRCIYIPRRQEAQILAVDFLANINYIYNLVHHLTLLAIIDEIYDQIDRQEPLKPGSMVLLLSVIASSTHVWTTHSGTGTLFSTAAEAHTQTALWIRATRDVLDAGQSSPPLSLEAVLGVIVLSFITCNIEGVSLRYRGLISLGLLLGRELGLHRIDGELAASSSSGVIEAEMGRRAWWYLAATDWLLAARYGGPLEGVYQVHPRHMVVKKPRNMNDADLSEDGPNIDHPLSELTDMSYFLHRLRLAEVSRSIVDHNSMAMKTSTRASHHSHVMTLDFELNQMIRDIPPFLDVNNYPDTPGPESYGAFVQAYLLNSMIQTQRCIIHLDYLISGSQQSPGYASSRETCIGAARQILRAERQLVRTRHPFVQTRVRLAAILHGVFMASIVLLMDACVNGGPGWDCGSARDEVAEALRVVEDASDHSLAAAKLHESLVQVLARYRGQGQEARGAAGATPVDLPDAGPPSLEEPMDTDSLQWDDLFSSIDMPSFF